MFNSLFSNHFNLNLQEFSLNNDGHYIIGKYDNQDAVVIKYGAYNIIFDSFINYTVSGGSTNMDQFSRVRTECNSLDFLRFELKPEGVLDKIGKLFTGQDIKVGNSKFDNQYHIKGSDASKIKSIFSNEKIQNLIFNLIYVKLELFEIDRNNAQNSSITNSVLYYKVDIELTCQNQFNDLLELFKTLIDTLERLESISPLRPAANTA